MVLNEKVSLDQNLNEPIDEKENFKKYRFVQIKKKYFKRENQQMTMIQIIDISDSILYDKSKAQNEFLSVINATVSHELRNPLNSISAENVQK